MGILYHGTKRINAGQIADLDSNNSFENVDLEYVKDAGTEVTIDCTGFQGVLVKANVNHPCQYSTDGGNTYYDFEQDNKTKEYLNMTNDYTSIKVKTTVSDTVLAILKG